MPDELENISFEKLKGQDSFDESSSFETSKEQTSGGEIPYGGVGKLPRYGESQKLEVPAPSISRTEFKGKTLTKWGIERRTQAKSLREIWNKATQNIDQPSFAMYVNQLINEINDLMPQYRDIDYEEVFAGILQLIQDALDGKRMIAFQKKKVPTEIVDSVFQIITKEEELNFELYKKVQKEFSEHKLLKLE